MSDSTTADKQVAIFRAACRRNLRMGFLLGVMASVMAIELWGLL